MDKLLEILSDPSFMPHGHCYLWLPDVLWLHVGSDLLIAISYYIIPLVLYIILRKRRQEMPYPEVLGLFVAFIFLCGTTHLLDIVSTWHPIYRFEGWVKLVTAAVSLLTAIVLIPRLSKFITLPGIQQAYYQLKKQYEEMAEQNEQANALHNASLRRENRIIELKQEINQLLENSGKSPRYKIPSQ